MSSKGVRFGGCRCSVTSYALWKVSLILGVQQLSIHDFVTTRLYINVKCSIMMCYFNYLDEILRIVHKVLWLFYRIYSQRIYVMVHPLSSVSVIIIWILHCHAVMKLLRTGVKSTNTPPHNSWDTVYGCQLRCGIMSSRTNTRVR